MAGGSVYTGIPGNACSNAAEQNWLGVHTSLASATRKPLVDRYDCLTRNQREFRWIRLSLGASSVPDKNTWYCGGYLLLLSESGMYLLNTSAALFVAGRVRSMAEGWELGAELIDSGQAAAKLRALALQ